MAYQHDTEFHDDDLPPVAPFVVSSTPAASGTTRGVVAGQVPTPEQLSAEVTDRSQQLVALRERQAQVERAKSELEELQRRRAEYDHGRGEVRDRVTHSITLLEQAEVTARREVEQLGKSLLGLREVAGAVQKLSDKAWSGENWNQDLSRDLAVIENARNELNSARQKWPILDGSAANGTAVGGTKVKVGFEGLPFLKLAQLGLALTWPLVVVALLAAGLFATLLLKK